jgi:serine protease Do
MESIMNDPRIGPVLDRAEAAPATKSFPMLVQAFCYPQRTIFAAVLSALLAVTAVGCVQTDRLYLGDSSGTPLPSFAPVVQEVMPAVVNVSAVQRTNKAAADQRDPGVGGSQSPVALRGLPPSELDELLRRFFERRGRGGGAGPRVATLALGSGFIIDPGGYVVTDDHVVENAETVTIITQDATEYSARIAGRDPMTDLALLKIDTERALPYVRWGDSDAARIGDWVLAVGNPFGLDNTVSSGIISGRGRDIHAGLYDDFLQIDAAINRGNSGGPTFDLHGNVIGINTAIYSPNGGSVGIGFAIPANRARPVVEQLRARGRVERGWLGVRIQTVTPELVQSLRLPKPAGALVAKVAAGGPAAAAGFEPGDVILSVNGRDIRRMRDLPLVIAEAPVGQVAAVTVWRRNAEITLWPVIGEMPNPKVAELGRDENQDRRSSRATAAPSPTSAASLAI